MKKFYKNAHMEFLGDCYQILLDGKAIKTRGKCDLHLPTAILAEKIAAEWQNQGDVIKPETMPLMSLSCTAIDSVMGQKDLVVSNLASYGNSDLTCYMAEYPAILIEKQNQAWQPLHQWINNKYGIKLIVTAGVIHVVQDNDCLEKFINIIAKFDAFKLTALHELITLSGSIVIALAVVDGQISAKDGFLRSIIDDIYQAETWGKDADADARNERRMVEFLEAFQFFIYLK